MSIGVQAPTGRARTILAGKAFMAGIGISVVGSLIWSLLMTINLRTTPQWPWSVLAMALVLLLGWRAIRHRGWTWPGSDTKVAVIARAPARAVHYFAACIIGIAGFLLVMWVVNLLDLPMPPLQQGADIAPMLLLVYFTMASLVAALCEEFGFRGCMQSGLNITLGQPLSFAIGALCFAGLHAANPAWVTLLPIYIALALTWSFLVRWSGSIWPSVLSHYLANFLSYLSILLLAGSASAQ